MLQVVDQGKNRAIQVEKEGFPDAVVWNPWIKKAAGMADFGDDQYKVCMHSSALNVENSRNALYLQKVHGPAHQAERAPIFKPTEGVCLLHRVVSLFQQGHGITCLQPKATLGR